MYGYDVESVDEPCVINPDKSVKMAVRLMLPGATLINFFPILASIPAWFPGAISQKLAAEIKRLTDEIVRAPMDWAKMRIVCQLEIVPFPKNLTIEPRAKERLSHPLLLISLKRRIPLVRRKKKKRQSEKLRIRCTVVGIASHSRLFNNLFSLVSISGV